MTLAERIFRELQRCVGAENAIGAVELAARVESHERAVRRVIAEEGCAWARKHGRVLLSCSGNRGGFYLATDAEEVARIHTRDLRDRLYRDTRIAHREEMIRAAGLGGLITRCREEARREATEEAA